MADQSLSEIRPIVTRKEAKAAGLTRYFTGKPCTRGHVDYRNVCDHGCCTCGREKAKIRRASNPEIAKREQEARKRRYRCDQAFRAKRIEEACQWGKENRERRIPYMREYYQQNKERLREENRLRWASYSNDPAWLEKERLRNRTRHKENPEAKRSFVRNRRAMLREADGRHNAKDIAAILKRQGNKCAYCKASLKDGYEVDHITPISRGGSNWPSNLQCLCPTCNGKKWCKDPLDFAREMGKLL